MFTVVKVLNNNIVLALTDAQNEVVVFGTGIGFKRRKVILLMRALSVRHFILIRRLH